MPALLPIHETSRLETLRSYHVLDTPPEAAFDRIVKLACRALEAPIAAVSFVDEHRQWFKASIGLPVCETTRDVSFCAHAILEDEVFTVPDATLDDRFSDNPLVTGDLQIRSYAGAPLRAPDGQVLGALCVFDHRPRKFSRQQREILTDLADMVMGELALRTERDLLKDLHASVEKLVNSRTSELTKVNESLADEIRERELADEGRRSSERRFRQIFNQASDAAFVHDVHGRLTDINEAACASLGYSREEMLTMGVADFEMTHTPAGLDFWRELPSGCAEKFDGCHRRKDGSTFPVEVHVSVLDTAQGRRLLALVRDISERKRNEEVLKARATRQEALAELGARALGGSSIDEMLRAAVKLLGDGLGMEFCRVFEYQAGRASFVRRAGLRTLDADEGSTMPGAEIAYAEYVFRTGQPVVTQDADKETRFRVPTMAHTLGLHSGMCVLIGGPNADDERFGVIAMATRSRRAITDDDVFFAQSVANTLAAAIERRKNDDELRSMETRYHRIAANSPGMVFQLVMKPDFSISIPFVSEGCRQVYECEPAEVQANPAVMHRVVHPHDKENYKKVLRASVATLEPFHWEGRIVLPSGSVRWVTARARLEPQPNGEVIWDGLVLDVTELKEAQQEAIAAKEKAEAADSAKSAFLSRMSHELRTPLNAILGFGQVMEFGQLAEQDRQCVQYILKGGRHLLSLVDEVLDLSRAETGELHLVSTRVCVESVARDCLGLTARLAQPNGIQCRVKSSRNPVSIWCDEQRLRQMLLNLISNAIKYNREGGLVIIGCETIGDDKVRIKVSDTGRGLSPEAVGKLFVPFERLEQQYGGVEGTGLGLVVSRRIAEAMGGSIGVESEVGRGSSFWVELPLGIVPEAAPLANLRLDGSGGQRSPISPAATLLYIEDNDSNLQVVEMLLGRQRPDWKIITAKEGESGLVLASRHLPDLILLDLQLPGISGEEVLAKLRADPLTHQIPVVVLSADATAHSQERLLADGAHRYVTKPFVVETLLSVLDGFTSDVSNPI